MIDAHASWPRLVADIGGTHARFALETAPQRLARIEVLAVGEHGSVLDVVRAYLARVGQPPLRHAALAVAAPIGGDWVQMSNHDWAFSIDATRRALHLETLIGLNDCAAQAWAVPHLDAAKLVQVGGGEPCPVAPKAIIGPGTGLGVSALLPAGRSFMVLAGEGGHVSFAPFDDTEMYLWQYARQKYGHVSAERLLSGAGLSLIYQALAAREQKASPALGAAQISARALSGHAPLARQSVDIFCAMLGTVAANLALTLGARGGVYLCGGILPRLVDDFKTSPFRHRFDNKGRFSAYLADIPVYVVLDAQAGLLGAAAALAAYLHLVA